MIEDFYDSSVSVQRQTNAQNAMGGTIKTYTDRISSLPCRISMHRVNETDEFGKRTARELVRIYCAVNTSTLQIIHSDRIIYGSAIYQITGISNPGKQNHHLEIDCMEII